MLMRTVAVLIILLGSTPALACEVLDWNLRTVGDTVVINEETSCISGKLVVRLYEGGRFVGSDLTLIEGYAFKAYFRGLMPPVKPTIKWSPIR